MASTLEELDREWSELATSPRARRALIRWANDDHPALAGLSNLDELLAARRDNNRAPALLAALAALAPTDELAARTLLQALVPGLARLSSLTGNDDPAAIDEMVSLAWERIRTYPTTRRGSVAGNVLLDVRKRYRRHRLIEVPASLELTGDPEDDACTPEDEVLGRLLIEELATAEREGIVSAPVLRLILRTRLGGESLGEVATEQHVAPQVLCQRRWRGEQRLRKLPLAG